MSGTHRPRSLLLVTALAVGPGRSRVLPLARGRRHDERPAPDTDTGVISVHGHVPGEVPAGLAPRSLVLIS
ncbi:hypothetical protein HEK616_07130 [Streptomyces nigrescens]|uniref:Secreted protein n=1 Tax=Streptomyces nigrescens TaxID=1920 RepID=A0ABM7ZLE5_STRNI|nr:hypothetical protein HEK616_07130 [Streptomyces nigrescens]